MTSQKAKILLVDDHTLILQGIKHVVSQMPEIEKVYTASSGAEAMLLIDSSHLTFICLMWNFRIPTDLN